MPTNPVLLRQEDRCPFEASLDYSLSQAILHSKILSQNTKVTLSKSFRVGSLSHFSQVFISLSRLLPTSSHAPCGCKDPNHGQHRQDSVLRVPPLCGEDDDGTRRGRAFQDHTGVFRHGTGRGNRRERISFVDLLDTLKSLVQVGGPKHVETRGLGVASSSSPVVEHTGAEAGGDHASGSAARPAGSVAGVAPHLSPSRNTPGRSATSAGPAPPARPGGGTARSSGTSPAAPGCSRQCPRWA